ncbi:S1/P1 nuclease-domain-containing protein [Russula brevipes]|nr:S1/P1 nuclease-domain-containing protein [Russula brevipes]
MRTFLIAAAVVGLGSLPRVIAWGAAGHEIVATIAQSHLDPQVLTAVCSILASDDGVRADPPCYLSTVATWADKIRFRNRWSAPLHYIGATGDHPPDSCLFPGADGWEGTERANVLDAIHNVSSILTDFVQGSSSSSSATAAGAPQLAQEALKFLIHFVGDMHQPLHLTGRDRGGNSIKVDWDKRPTNLHSVWDNSLIAKAIRLTPANYTRPIRAPVLEDTLRGAIYDPYIRRIVWEGLGVDRHRGLWTSEAGSWLACPAPAAHQSAPEEQQVLAGPRKPKPKPRPGNGPPATSDSDVLCPHAWAAPIHKLNCDVVWTAELDSPSDGELPQLDKPEYSGKIEDGWVVEKLLAQGGVRLAGILNAIFAPQRK